MRFKFIIFFYFLIHIINGQNSFNSIIKDNLTKEPIIGATVELKGTAIGTVSNELGQFQMNNIPNGVQVIIIRYTGYNLFEAKLEFPINQTYPEFLLDVAEKELEELTVVSTRSNRSIETIPTRVEVLTDEIDEASTMDPSKVAHLLTHSTGIQVQTTSATSNTANVRIQGLDGRYTQILKDGFPLYGGFSGSLSVMQIPPLDLRQIEYIKGGASTLYGAGAISGLINVITKEPESNESLFHINFSQIGAFDMNTFVSRKYDKIGFTLLAQRNTHKAFDADKDGYSDMPQLTKYNFNPKLVFYLTDRSALTLAGTLTQEVRQGGDMNLMKGGLVDSIHFYKEHNEVQRNTTQIKFEHKLNESSWLTLRNSFNFFDRSISIFSSPISGEYKFAGDQFSSFSEISFSHRKHKNVFITGLNFYSDQFKEIRYYNFPLRNESSKTIGAFANYVFDLGSQFSIESGLRADYVLNDKVYFLPRVSTLIKWTKKLSSRVGGGMGYRNASIFNQEAEIYAFNNVFGIDRNTTKAEQSFGGNADIGYRFTIGEKVWINLNQMFFYSQINDPLQLIKSGERFTFFNSNGYTQSKGAETFFKVGFSDFVFFAGYTFTDAKSKNGSNESVISLTPMHSLKGDLLYSIPMKWRIGADYEFKSSQTLSSGRKTPAYWTFGALVERTLNNYIFFLNIENIFDYRQTRKESLLSLPFNTPQFTEVWAPLDGLVFNFGAKIKL